MDDPVKNLAMDLTLGRMAFKAVNEFCDARPNAPLNEIWAEVARTIREALAKKASLNLATVRDGQVRRDEMVWWRCATGPVHVDAKEHWVYILDCPENYQLREPLIKIVYLTEEEDPRA